MSSRGKFIAIEGIDGSGKRTQLEMLAGALRKRGVKPACTSFPHYQGFFGHMVAQYLNGEFGRLADVDPHFSALLYAADRLENKAEIEKFLAKGELVLSDRYIGSNLAHQTARVPKNRQAEFLRWLEKLEYGLYGLPHEDLVVYLKLPATLAQKLVSKKGARAYTLRRRDLQEANLVHLKAAASIYERLAHRRNWIVVDCTDGSGRRLLSPDEIHRKVMDVVEKRVFRTRRGS